MGRRRYVWTRFVERAHATQLERALRVPHLVQRARLDALDPAWAIVDQHGALVAGLARVPTLQIAGKHHPRLAAQHFARVHVAERPIVVALAA